MSMVWPPGGMVKLVLTFLQPSFPQPIVRTLL